MAGSDIDVSDLEFFEHGWSSVVWLDLLNLIEVTDGGVVAHGAFDYPSRTIVGDLLIQVVHDCRSILLWSGYAKFIGDQFKAEIVLKWFNHMLQLLELHFLPR